MARLYADENFPLPVVEELRKSGHDVLTIQEDGKANQSFPDEEVLSAASSSNRAVLTINHKHFVRLHIESSRHSGIISCTFDPDFEGQARRIHDTILAHDSLEGQLFRVNRRAV
jgi:hypothetical protein